MNQHQLKPLLHYGLSLVFEQDVFTCNKYRKNTVRSFTLKDPQLKTPRLNKVTSKSKVLIIVKKLKFIKAAKLKDSSLLTNDSLKPARMLVLVKNLRTVESLCIKEVLSEKLPISLDIWLRNAKRVKSVTCLSVREINPLKLKLEKKVRKLFLWINRLKLKSLNIQATQIPGKNISPFIFQKYPSSLEEFSLSCALWEFYLPTEPKIPVDLNNSLNNLAKLKTLHFGIEDSKGVMVLLLNSIVDLSQLETLDLAFEDRKTCPIPNLLPFLSTLGKSNSIKRLRLSFASPPDNLETIFHSVNVGSLKEFEFFGALNSKSHWTLLSTVISGLDSLESLKLVLSNPNLKTQDLDLQKFPADLWLAVTKLLKKPIPLQALTLEFSDQNSLRYNQILRLLKDTAPSLRLLHINLGNYYPSKSDFHQTVELLKELKQIENLDLSCVGIPGEQCFKDIVEWCYTSRNLRLLSLGKVEAIESNELFARLVEKVITKRGIEYFSCSAAESFKMSFDKADKDIPYINLKEAKLKNPALEHYPKFIITKSRGPIEFLVQKYEDWDRKPKLKYL